MRRKVQRRL
jgi:hypothetical protein